MKKLLIITAIIVALLLAYGVFTGCMRNTSAYIGEFELSQDGSQIAFDAGVGASTGCIRRVKVESIANGTMNIAFMSAFGGINGGIGAKSRFCLPLTEEITAIAVYRGDRYETALIKGENGWTRV